MENNISLSEITALLDTWDDIAIITHANPDADCIGSAFAIKYAYPEKNIRVICPDKIPGRLAFICDGSDTGIPSESYGHIITVDCAELHLTGAAGKKYAEAIELKIDHHRTSEDYAKYNYAEPETGSAGEIVYKIIKDRLNIKAASALYAAIASDTGCFRYSNVSSQTHITAAELISMGVDTTKINTLLFETKPVSEINATRLALNNLEFHFDGRIALVGFTNEMKEENGLDDDSLGAVSAITREIEGVDLGIVIKEKTTSPGVYKISMRSKESIDCSAICQMMGGGGHLRASGAAVEAKTLDEAKAVVLCCVKEHLNG